MNSKTKILIGILVIVITLIGGWWIWNSNAVEKESGYSLIEWDEINNTKSREKVSIVGYLTSALQYPMESFREEENYQFLSPNKGYPIKGQIPLIIDYQEIECNGRVEVNGEIVLRKGSAGKGILGTTDYVLLKVESWRCLNTTKTDRQEIGLKKTTAETIISDANGADLPIITIAEEAALHDGELVRIIGEFQVVGSKSESGKKYWINTASEVRNRNRSFGLNEVLFDLSFDSDKFSEIEILNKKRVMATGRIKYIPIEHPASEPQYSTLYLERISEFRGTIIKKVEQPYIFYGKRTFTVGSLYLPEESKFRTPIPKMKGEDIYRFYIKSDIYPVRVKMKDEREDIEVGDLAPLFFFTGYVKFYFINDLIKENPEIEWLRTLSLADLSVFEIEHMIPLEDNNSVLSVNVPENFSDEFEISVTVRNVLQVPLVDTKLRVRIKPGRSFIISDRDRDSYYGKTIEGKYDAEETKTYKIKVKKRDSGYRGGTEEGTKFEISVTFAGYGIEGDEEEVLLEANKIKPLYSKEIRKYQLLWIKD